MAVYYNNFFTPSKASSPNSPSANTELFKHRKVAAQAMLRELQIYPADDAPEFSAASEDRIFRDLELRLLGAKSTALMFNIDSKETKFFPWDKDDSGVWAVELSTLEVNNGADKNQEIAAKLQARLQAKYNAPEIAVRGNMTSLFVYVNTDEAFAKLTAQLVQKAGRETAEVEINHELRQEIENITRGVEVIDGIELNLGIGGETHNPFNDASLAIKTNGHRKEIDVEGSVGSNLTQVIRAANSTREIRFAPNVEVTLKVPEAIAKAAKLTPWHFHKKGLFAIPSSSGKTGQQFTIITNNIHEVAAELAETFKGLPKFGFDELKNLQGVADLAELRGASSYR